MTYKNVVSKVFLEITGESAEMDFVDHVAAHSQLVAVFNSAKGKSVHGPDFANIQFDMTSRVLATAWNLTIFNHITDKIMKEDDLPKPLESKEFYASLVVEKFKRCKAYWKEGQCQVKSDGQLETEEEVRARLEAKDVTLSKAGRHASRRHSVS